MNTLITRRNFFGLLAAPAIIRIADLMPIKTPSLILPPTKWISLGKNDFVEGSLPLPIGEYTFMIDSLTQMVDYMVIRFAIDTGQKIPKRLIQGRMKL